MRKVFALKGSLLGLMATLALVLASCGGGQGTSTPPPPTATARPATPTAGPSPTAPPSVAPTPTQTPVPATATVVPAEQPKYGGILRRRMTNDFASPDLYDNRAFSDISWFMAIFNNLVLINPYKEAELVPDLAESWTVSGDAAKLIFKLRRGVQWHDGKPLTAGDVAYTYNRALNPPSAAIRKNAGIFVPVSAVQATDESTVVVTLKRPSASFLRGIGSSSVPILPAHLPNIEEWAKNPVGTGPFKFDKRQASVSLDFVKSAGYWGRDKRGSPLPYLDGMHLTVVADLAAALAAIRARQFDLTIPGDSIALTRGLLSGAVQRDLPDLVLGKSVGGRFDLQFNKVAPFTDLRVRKAIHLAFDREALAVIKSAEQPVTPLASPLVQPELGGLWGLPEAEVESLPGFRKDKTADRAEAKSLLQQAGVDPTKFSFRISTSGQNVDIAALATLIGEQGFKVTVQIFPGSGAFVQALLNGDFEIARNFGIPTFDDPSSYLTDFVVTGGSSNYGKWSDPQLDSLLEQQESTLDVAKRRQLLLEAQRRVLETLFIAPVFSNQNNWGWFSYVKNQPKWTVGAFGTQYRFEEVWLAK